MYYCTPPNIFSCNFSFYFKLALVDVNVMGLYYRVQMTPFHIYIIMLGLIIIKTNFVKNIHFLVPLQALQEKFHQQHLLHEQITIINNESQVFIASFITPSLSLHLELILCFMYILIRFVLLHISFMSIQCYKLHRYERLSI